MLGPDYSYTPEDILLPSVFEKKITILERDRLLRKIAQTQGIDFRLYTNSKTDIKNRGIVDYATKMPLVFNKSRINLNISLRSIHSGIPLRVIDIMACGGFVLSNYQKEIAEYFKEDREVVMFRSKEEAIEKIRYYLDHEEERAAIALAGYEAVKERFGYKDRIPELLG
ncbi:MAG: glycosyltransferase, partial [Lachnospiraceae bacterium]|nr:glycosyltransferase [Lachnospiraceae bacterium]